jgi:4-hydroxy-tetrahydrodipicolinate synthase
MEYARTEAKAWAKKKLWGFYECPITPMTKDFTLDEAGIRSNIDAYVEMGVPGLVVGGNLAEGWNMTPSDWLRYHQIIADANDGRVDLWTIILDSSVHQALEKMAFAEKLGFVGAEVMNPPLQLKTDNEIHDYFTYLTDHSPMAIVLYRTPVAGKLMGPELIKRLSQIDTIVGVKEGSLIQGEARRVRRAAHKDFIVSDPVEEFFFEDLRHGGQVMWANLCYLAFGKKRHLMKEYFELARAGKWEEGREKWQALRPLSRLFEEIMIEWIIKTGSYASAVAFMKVWFEAIGLKAGPVLPPVHNIDGAQREWLVGRLQEAGAV